MADEPPYLVVGTEVSAKYRGAFCEAKVKKVNRLVKIKVNLKETAQPMTVNENDIVSEKPSLKVGTVVEIRHPSTGVVLQALVNKVHDQSMYTVVFNDGDESTLRRSQVNLKGEKHYERTDTLDELPLTNPEHFSTPVRRRYQERRRRRDISSDSSSSGDECDGYPAQLKGMLGKLYLMRMEDRKKSMEVPVLVVLSSSDSTPLPSQQHLLVKSFKDSKFYAVKQQDLRPFTRDAVLKNEDRTLKVIFEKALLYFDGGELPANWSSKGLLGLQEEEEESSEEETVEEKDRFVAQLYKFMDDRGTPFNKAPMIGSRDLDLYRLYRLVQRLGGYNRVNNQMKWRLVASKMGLSATTNSQTQAKNAYKKFLYPYDEFYRKLGSSMGTIAPRSGLSRSTPRRSMMRQEIRTQAEIKSVVIKPVTPASLSPRVVITTSSSSIVASPPAPKEVKDADVDARRRTRQERGKEERGKEERGKEERGKEERGKEESEESDDSRHKKMVRQRSLKATLSDTEDTKSWKTVDREEDDTMSVAESTKTDEGEHKDYSEYEYPPGSRLRVRYGKGKTHKLYEAKVLEADEDDASTQHYYVHYAGWNVRYDEWITTERVVEAIHVVEKAQRPVTGTKIPALKKKSLKTWTQSTVEGKEDNDSDKTRVTLVRLSVPPRPTRSTSLESTKKQSVVIETETQDCESSMDGRSSPASAELTLHVTTDTSKHELGIPELSPIKEMLPDHRNLSVSSDLMDPPEITGGERCDEEEGRKVKKKSPQVKTRAGRAKEQVKQEPIEVAEEVSNRRLTRTKAELKAGITPLPSQQPASQQPASQQPASQQPASQQPASQQPASQQPASQQPASQQPASQQPASQPASQPVGQPVSQPLPELPSEPASHSAIDETPNEAASEAVSHSTSSQPAASEAWESGDVGKDEEEANTNEAVDRRKRQRKKGPKIQAQAKKHKTHDDDALQDTKQPGWVSARSVDDEPSTEETTSFTPEHSGYSDAYECSQSEVEANLEVESYFLASQAATGPLSRAEQSPMSDDVDSDVSQQKRKSEAQQQHKKGHKRAKHSTAEDESCSKDEDNSSATNPLTYNLLDKLKEGQGLNGDELINFLLDKVKEVRGVYSDLKSEMVSLERRRKRYRRKQRLAVQALMGLDQTNQ